MNLLKTAIFFEFISVNNKNNGFENNVINVKKTTYTLEKGQSRMDNPETQAILGTQDTERRTQTNYTTQKD